MNTRHAWYACGAVLLLAFSGSCGESTSPPDPSDGIVATVELDPAAVTLAIGAARTLDAIVRDSSGERIVGRTLSWSTSDPAVATVTQSGTVTGRGFGAATITATIDEESGSAVVTTETTANDFSVVAQWTQATQSGDGSIPMVRGGNGAAVNVLISSTVSTVRTMDVVLRITNASGVVTRAETLSVAVSPNAAPSYSAPTAQFRLLPSELVAGMRWQVLRDPQGDVPDASAATDVFPRTGPQQLAMVDVPVLKLRFVPIVLTAHNDATGNVSAANLAEYTRMVETVLPIGALQATVGTNFTTSQSFGTTPDQGGHATTFWQPILIQLDLARIADPDPSVHWIGVVLPPAGFTLTRNGGIAYVASNGTSTGAGTRTSMVTSFGWANDPAFTRNTVAHELGHNFGRPHAPCGPVDNADPEFPYPGGLIGVAGHDVRGWMAGRVATAVAAPPTYFDLMGYCTPGTQNWISDFNYRTILNFRTTTTAAAAPATRVLLVSGAVDASGGVTLNPAFAIDAAPSRPERTGAYRVEGRAANGDVVFADTFEPSVIDHAPGAGHFAFAIPLSAERESMLASIEVRGPAGVVRIERPVAQAALRTPGAIAPERLRGTVRVACSDANARGVIVRNASTGVMLGMATGSTARIAADPGTRLAVVCSDGVQSARTTVIAP